MSRRTYRIDGRTNGGLGFRPFHWRPDAPSGSVAVPEGPPEGWEPPPEPIIGSWSKIDREAAAATARNVAQREAALAPRRYRP